MEDEAEDRFERGWEMLGAAEAEDLPANESETWADDPELPEDE